MKMTTLPIAETDEHEADASPHDLQEGLKELESSHQMRTPRKKVAVVVTHGMGEQIPMETLRGFVEAAWVTDEEVHWDPPADENPDEDPADIWFTPDPVTGSLELHRITTRWTKSTTVPRAKGPRVDFFEFYWADLAEGTTVQEVWDWLRTLLLRWPEQVPKGLMGVWLLLWTVSAIVAALSLLAVSPWPGGWWHAVFAIAAAGLAYIMQYLVSPYLGDVARYVRADPRNIAMRYAIRERGLKLLNDLHDCGSYERIIMVAHSLGTVIAYDLLSFLWATRKESRIIHEDEAVFLKARAVEAAAHSLATATAEDSQKKRRRYREAQRTFRLALRSGGENRSERKRRPGEEWLISDFVTLGSPLAHAQFLLARDMEDLNEKIRRFLFPTNWPQFEKIQSEQRRKIEDRQEPVPAKLLGPPEGLFSFFLSQKTWIMHPAAPFAAVRWTNIYDPHRMIFQGDIISGPVAPVFGKGIHDINLKELRGQSFRFSHTLYWAQPGGKRGHAMKHIEELRKAINLLDKPDGGLW
jgi:hypothetical protein